MPVRLSNEIILGLQRGDETCFNVVYDRYRDLLYVIVYSILKDPEASKDVLQDTFVTVFEKARTLSHPDRFHGWVLTVARNLALNAKKSKRDVLLDPEAWETKASEDAPDNFLSAWHRFLSEEENLVIAYKVVYELTFAEIVHLVGKPLTTVYKIYAGALKKLRQAYQAEGK